MSDNSYSSSYTVWTNGKQNTNSAQPVLQAYLSGTVSNVTGDNTVYLIPFNIASVDTAAALNTGTGVYTFPKTGKYIGTVQIQLLGLNSGHNLIAGAWVTTSQTYQFFDENPFTGADSGGNRIFRAQFYCNATAGDTGYFQFNVNNGTKVVDVYGGAAFYTLLNIFLTS